MALIAAGRARVDAVRQQVELVAVDHLAVAGEEDHREVAAVAAAASRRAMARELAEDRRLGRLAR